MNDQPRRAESKIVVGNLSEQDCRLELISDGTETLLAPDDSVVVDLTQNERVEIQIGYRAGGMRLTMSGAVR